MTYQNTDKKRGAAVQIPQPGEGKRGEAGYLTYLLRQANAAVRLRLEATLGELGVTLPQFLVMTMVRAYPGASGHDLARLALLTPQTVHLITRNLERAGWLAKSPHPVHGRILCLTLTPEGRALHGRCRRRTRQVEATLAARLDPAEQQVVRRWLTALALPE